MWPPSVAAGGCGSAIWIDHFFADGALRDAFWWSAQQTAWSVTNSVERQVAALRP
jgi:hypothetical protein